MAARELPDAVARPESTSSARTSASAGSAVHNGAIAPHISAKSREAGSGADAREPDVERDARSKDAAADVSFEVTFAENDPLNPRHRYGALRKWSMVLVVSSTSTCVTCTSSLYTQTYGQIQPEFYTSEIIATLGLSLFVAGLGLGPMLLAPLSEVRSPGGLRFPCPFVVALPASCIFCLRPLSWRSIEGRQNTRITRPRLGL